MSKAGWAVHWSRWSATPSIGDALPQKSAFGKAIEEPNYTFAEGTLRPSAWGLTFHRRDTSSLPERSISTRTRRLDGTTSNQMLETDATQLAVIVPTFRFDDVARQALTAAAAVGSESVRVHIGDNSENPEKHAFLHRLAARSRNVVVSCHPSNIGAEANWLFLVRSQRAPFMCLACDDDCFAPAFFAAGASILLEDVGCSAASGLLLSVAEEPPREVPILYSPPQRTEADPLARIRLYNNQNAIAYASSRRQVISDFADYVEANPLKGAFNDYLLAFHLLSIGTYRLDRRGHVYVYNNDGWHLPGAAHVSSAKFYVGCGLPEGFTHLSRLHWAVANAHFFQSRFRGAALTNAQGKAIAAYLFDRMRRDFDRERSANRSAVDALLMHQAEAQRSLADLTRGAYDGGTWIFNAFARIVAAFSADLADRYLRFLTETTLPHVIAGQPAPARWRPSTWLPNGAENTLRRVRARAASRWQIR